MSHDSGYFNFIKKNAKLFNVKMLLVMVVVNIKEYNRFILVMRLNDEYFLSLSLSLSLSLITSSTVHPPVKISLSVGVMCKAWIPRHTYSLVFLQVVTSYCPANKQPIAQVQQGTVQDLDECIRASQEAWQVRTHTYSGS